MKSWLLALLCIVGWASAAYAEDAESVEDGSGGCACHAANGICTWPSSCTSACYHNAAAGIALGNSSGGFVISEYDCGSPIPVPPPPPETPAQTRARLAREAADRKAAEQAAKLHKQKLVDSFKPKTDVAPTKKDPAIAALKSACLGGDAAACAKLRAAKALDPKDSVVKKDTCQPAIKACDQQSRTCKLACPNTTTCMNSCNEVACQEPKLNSTVCIKARTACYDTCRRNEFSCSAACPSCKEVRACLTKTAI